MASQGPNSPGTAVNDTTVGSVAWSNPGNVLASDDSRATIVLTTGQVSNYIKATNFGFSIPSGATIDGILVEVERSTGQTTFDNAIRIVKGGTIGATDRSGSFWSSGPDAYKSYGGASDLWGESWTDSDINGSSFGFAYSVKEGFVAGSIDPKVDHIRITVYYTEGGGGGGAQASQGAFASVVRPVGLGIIRG